MVSDRLKNRFDAKVDRGTGDECWKWTGSKAYNGRGTILVKGETKRAQRVSYEMHVGVIPSGTTVRNRCGEVGCVNPGHLYLAYRDGVELGKSEVVAPASLRAVESASQLLNLEVRLPAEQPGIYVLFNGGVVVYVGQSNNVFRRVGQHHGDIGKDFDEWTYVVVRDRRDRLRFERELIALHKPAHNRA